MTATPSLYNADGSPDHEMLDLLARAGHIESAKRDMEMALTLTAAGWSAELTSAHLPHPFTGNVPVMSWFWRRPPRRPGKPGRRYLSTQQAFNAYSKELAQ